MLKEKSNLCCSNRPRHVFLIQGELFLSGSFTLFALLSIDSINKVIYASKANWYIGSIKLMSFKTKKRIAARCAQDLYSSLARSISFSVCSETTNDSSIEVEVAFDDCSVLSKSRSSSRVSPATFSRLYEIKRKGSKEAKDILLEYFVLEFFESSFIGRDREDQIVLLFFELRLLFSDHDSQELVFQSCAQDNKVLDFVSSGYLFLYRPLDLVRLPFILLSVSIPFALYYLPSSN